MPTPPTPSSRSVASARPWLADLALAAAALSAGSAVVHVSEIGPHAREYWLFGLLFGVVGALQLAWAELVRRFPRDEVLLLAGALLSLSIAWVWAVSRTEGLPIGPHPWVPEALGIRDLLATSAELVVVGLVALVLTRRAAPSWLAPSAWALAAANVVVAFA